MIPEPKPGEAVVVKICGITRAEDADDAIAAGADAIGINFWPGSKRYIAPERAAAWARPLAGRIFRIGVFVNASLEEVEATIREGLVDAVQFHGDETGEYCAEARARGLDFICAIAVKSSDHVLDLSGLPCRSILLDAFAPGAYGGTGRRIDWAVARRVVEENSNRRVILSGGLDPQNVAEAVLAVGPAGVDVASGVEASPGIKDADKVREFVARAKRPTHRGSR
ncbi:phosphoribosylanthranilate isomerase [soil metagenome]